MAISVISIATNVPFYYKGTSNNSSQPNFKYIIDIFTGTTYINRIKIIPRTDGSVLIDPVKLLENNVYYNFELLKTNGIPNNGESYTLNFGEEYGELNHNNRIYSGLTSITFVNNF
jgi:hypothetical protein